MKNKIYFNEQQAVEVDWYKINGRFPNGRIKKDCQNQPYVIGDFSWNTMDNYEREEFVERRMPRVEINMARSKS